MTSSHLIDTPAADIEHGTLYVAFELSKSTWRIGLLVSGERRLSQHSVSGGDTSAVWQVITRKRGRAEQHLGRPVRVVNCYEAGYDSG